MRTYNTPFYYKNRKYILLCLLTWPYDYHSLGRTTPVLNIFHGPKVVPAIEVLPVFSQFANLPIFDKSSLCMLIIVPTDC